MKKEGTATRWADDFEGTRTGIMTGDRDRGATNKGGPHDKDKNKETPGWANGLRQLYDSVVEEPIPDSFKDLLSKLDDKD